MQAINESVHIAVCDDDPRLGETIRTFLLSPESEIVVFSDPIACDEALSGKPVDILITDLDMPGMDGITLMKRVRARSPATDIIVITGHADKTVAIQALRMGAFDFFEKPVSRDELLTTVHRTLTYRRLTAERDRLAEQVDFLSKKEAEGWGLDRFVGNTPALTEIIRQIQLLRRSRNTAVLILGESGTGKELVAHAIHASGPRAGKPFVPVNCSAVPTELAESLLFGHTRGAFTGATANKRGAFDIADGGTLFLDEIGDMPLPIQAKLLRVLEDGRISPVGAPDEHAVDVRIVAATNTELEQKVAEHTFRGDLFYRLSAFCLRLPPLRERREDLPALFHHFVARFAAEMGISPPPVSDAALLALAAHEFRGNVRELRNIAERAIILAENGPIGREHIRLHPAATTAATGPSSVAATPTDGDNPTGVASAFPYNLATAEAFLIQRAIRAAGGNMTAAARLLGINRTKLYRKAGKSPPADGADAN